MRYDRDVETGSFAMFDALGIRGIWEKHDADGVVRKFERIEVAGRQIVDGDFGGPGHPNTAQPANFVKAVRLGFISDTIVVAFINKEAQYPVFTLMMAARYAGEIARLALGSPAPWAYRGVITYGRFAIHQKGNFFVGPAVDEAAAHYEQADGALIWFAPSAREEMASANSSDFQGAATRGEHDVPLKSGQTFRTYLASPFPMGSSPTEAQAVTSQLLSTFDLNRPDVRRKHDNTRAFLHAHLEEHARVWNEQQALLRRWGYDQ